MDWEEKLRQLGKLAHPGFEQPIAQQPMPPPQGLPSARDPLTPDEHRMQDAKIQQLLQQRLMNQQVPPQMNQPPTPSPAQMEEAQKFQQLRQRIQSQPIKSKDIKEISKKQSDEEDDNV